MLPIAAQRQAGCADSLDGAQAIALDAGHLNQAFDRVAGHAKVMFQRNLCCILDLLWRAMTIEEFFLIGELLFSFFDGIKYENICGTDKST